MMSPMLFSKKAMEEVWSLFLGKAMIWFTRKVCGTYYGVTCPVVKDETCRRRQVGVGFVPEVGADGACGFVRDAGVHGCTYDMQASRVVCSEIECSDERGRHGGSRPVGVLFRNMAGCDTRFEVIPFTQHADGLPRGLVGGEM